MQQVNSIYYPISINLDADPSKLKPTEGRFLKGTRFKIGRNIEGTAISGNDGMITPIQSNEIYCPNFVLPDGINDTIGAFEFRELNEIYWIVWNSMEQFTVNVIDGLTQTCKQVYRGSCLNLSLAPEHFISEHRIFMKVQYDEENGVRTIREKFLIFTDANNNIRNINVLASIGSQSFTTPYFEPVYPFYERCSYITLAPVAPMKRPTWELVERVQDAEDKDTPNKLFNRAIQVAIQFVYGDGRQSTISPYSAPIIVGGTDCSEQNPDTLSRCADFKFWVGNPFVTKINIFFRECTTCVTGNCNEAWFKYDTIEKNKCQEDLNWWERSGRWEEYDYDIDLNEITYRFCANKECTPVDQNIFLNIENEIPFKTVGLAGVGDRIAVANNLVGSNNMTCEEVESFDITVVEHENSGCTFDEKEIEMYVILRNHSEDSKGNGNECEFIFGDIVNGQNSTIDGKLYWGGAGYRDHPIGGAKVAWDGRNGWDSWKDYDQYVPGLINDKPGNLVMYLAGTEFVAIGEQVKYFDGDCDVQELGPIYRSLATMYNANGSFDDIIEALKDGEYLILQRFKFKVPPGRYVARLGGHRSGMDLGFERTSTYLQGYESVTPCPLSDGESITPAIKSNTEWTINVCENDYNSLKDGFVMKVLDNTYPDFESDARNVIDYNFVREVYLSEDTNHSIPFEGQQLNFEFGYFKEKLTNTIVTIDGFEVSGTPLYLIDPLTVNILGLGFLIPCPPAPFLALAGTLATPSGIVADDLRTTDHNGFVWHVEHFWRWRIFYNVLVCSPMDMTAQFGEPKLGTLSITHTDSCGLNTITIQVGISQVQPPVTALHNRDYKGLLGTVYKSTGTDDQPCNRQEIKGIIKSQENKPLAGVNVGYTGSQFVKTDGFGNFVLIAHQNTSFNRSDFIMIGNSGSACLIACIEGSDEGSSDEETCVMCCSDMYFEQELEPCIDCEEIIIDLGLFLFRKVNFPDKGLRGRYGFAVQGWDLYGRIVTGAANLIKYIDTSLCWNQHPDILFSQNGLLLNDEIAWITWSRTQNLYGSVLQWVADKFILIDGNGNETSNKGQAVAVAVDMTSLLDYNRQNNFNTLVSYGFVKGDILRILDDCNNPIQYLITGTTFGTVLPTATQQQLQVSAGGATATATTNVASDNGGRVIIPFDNRIDDLLERCAVKIEIVRPYKCTSEFDPYCEVGDSIHVIDGDMSIKTGIIVTWDTYKIFRHIPKDASCDENPNDNPYFSNNITDFWGENCNDCGRKLSINPYAERRWNNNEMRVSKSFVNNGAINGFGTFWTEDVKQFKSQNYGGIVAIVALRGAIWFLCENDYYICPYDQNYLQLTENGYVQASFPDKIGEPQAKIGMNFGCSYEHTATISIFEGTVSWLDAKNAAWIESNFQQAKDISLGVDGQGLFKSYLVEKLNYIQSYNEGKSVTDIFEITAGICPLHKERHLTFRNRNGMAQSIEDNYINFERDKFTDLSETIVWGMQEQLLLNLRAYIPEFYGKLRTSANGLQLISFVHGKPYKHNGNVTTTNVFFGIPTLPVIEFCANIQDSKIKIFMSLTEEIREFPLYVDRIITGVKNMYSYVPPPYFVKREGIHYTEILRNMSSFFDPNKTQTSMLIDGGGIVDGWALIRLTVTDENMSKPFELGRLWVLLSGSELSMKPQIAAPE